jgi:hypothetical protein
MTRIFFPDSAALMSPRTARYVQAMVREDFDYDEWLKEVREEETEAKRIPTEATSRDVVAARVDKPINRSGSWDVTPSLGPVRISKPGLNSRAFLPRRQPQSQTPKARLRRWLERVRSACGEFQASRPRDAVYGYLEAVFAIVMHYKVRRRTNRLLRHAFAFANLRFDKKTDPFTAVIRCTSEHDIDKKMVSKYARALRYASRHKEPDMGLKKFMKKVGGVNACAALRAKT